MHILLFLPNASLLCQEFGDLCTLYVMMNFLGCCLLTFVGSWLINAKEWKLKWSVKILNISELIKDAVNWYTDREISRNLVCWEATQFAFCQLHGRSSAWKFQDTNLTGLQNAEPPVFKSTTLFPLISNIVKMCQGQVSFLKKCLSQGESNYKRMTDHSIWQGHILDSLMSKWFGRNTNYNLYIRVELKCGLYGAFQGRPTENRNCLPFGKSSHTFKPYSCRDLKSWLYCDPTQNS